MCVMVSVSVCVECAYKCVYARCEYVVACGFTIYKKNCVYVEICSAHTVVLRRFYVS